MIEHLRRGESIRSLTPALARAKSGSAQATLSEEQLYAHRINRFRKLGAWLDPVEGNKLSPFSTWAGAEPEADERARAERAAAEREAAAAGEAAWQQTIADKRDWLLPPAGGVAAGGAAAARLGDRKSVV